MRNRQAKAQGLMRSIFGSRWTMKMTTHWLVAVFFAIATIIPTQPAFATIDNTATATGTPAAGTLTDATSTENVDVENAAPELTTVKTADDTTDVVIGQTITYTYTVTNTGNITINTVTVGDVHSGSGTLSAIADETLTDVAPVGDSTDVTADDGTWSVLAPGDAITFTATYTVTAADVLAAVDITNTATAAGTPVVGALTSIPDGETVTIAAVPSLSIVKTADDTTDVVVGQTIIYTYDVTNTGNVAIADVTISDVHNGSGPAPVPGSEVLLTDNGTPLDSTDAAQNGSWDTLAVGDVIRFTATYVVTQSDVETLQ